MRRKGLALGLRFAFGLRRQLGAPFLRRTTAAAAAPTAAAAAAGGTAPSATTAAAAPVGGLEGRRLHARHIDARDGGADQFLDGFDQAALVGRGQGEGMAGQAGTAGATDAMDIILGRERHVEIEYVAHRHDVEAAGGDVRGDQYLDFALLELLQRLHARGLAHVAMQRARVEAMLLQRGLEHRHVALAIAEHDGILDVLFLDQAAQRLALVRFRDDREALDDVLGGRGRHRNRDFLRVAQKAVGQTLDLRRHGRREEQGLSQRRKGGDDPLDVGNEPHVEHAVGFVDHQDLDVVQQDAAALEMVEQPAWRGDQHVGASLQRALLDGEAHAADQQRHVKLVVLAIDLEVFGHLGGQFAGRLEDERTRHARLGAALRENIDHRQDEGGGLSRARLGASEDIATHQDDGDGLLLDERGRRIALVGNCLQYRGAQPQTLKTHLISVV